MREKKLSSKVDSPPPTNDVVMGELHQFAKSQYKKYELKRLRLRLILSGILLLSIIDDTCNGRFS